MSKNTRNPKKKSSGGLEARRPKASDGSIYGALVIIGLSVVGGAFLLAEGDRAVWGAVAAGYIAAVVWLMILYAFRAWKGRSLSRWQSALARVPLRFAGYGTKDGKPVAAAHDSDKAKSAIMTFAVVGLVVVAGCAVVLLPGIL